MSADVSPVAPSIAAGRASGRFISAARSRSSSRRCSRTIRSSRIPLPSCFASSGRRSGPNTRSTTTPTINQWIGENAPSKGTRSPYRGARALPA